MSTASENDTEQISLSGVLVTPIERLQALIVADGVRLLQYFQRRVTVDADAADLVSETFVVLWTRIEALPRDEEGARMWMFGVARKVLLAHHRGELKRHQLATDLRESLRMSAFEHPDAAASNTVREAVLVLPERMREVVILVHWDGFSLVEAARILDANPATARSWYARARRRLQASLSDTKAV